ncbi:unnamed protein product [Allacma fusca]|uniref:Beta/gamma crystallin 'Greek key' domain-containing protein n=1 Tax=Allacma fusca TaxID=39272 RepID=A0A8J2LI16_9HEXA|nr:unnamed protein product [Allacma fusca]
MPELPEPYNQPVGITGIPCQDDCDSHDGLYFYCQLQNGLHDYCSPRPGTDPFGYDCDDNCSNTTISTKPLLFEEPQFHGRNYEIDDSNHNRCINIRYVNSSDENFDNKASSVDVGLSCLILHEQIGCTGKELRLSLNDNVNCHADLINCEFDDKTTSVSFCDSKFHRKNECEYQAYGGECCVDKCETQGKPYFWCNLRNDTWDYCFPRDGMDFLGNECDGNCTLNLTFPQSVALYEETNFNGQKRVLSSDNIERGRCQNFPHTLTTEMTLKTNISSVHLDSSCVLLIVSAQLCSAHLPIAYLTPMGSSGNYCFTQCHPRGGAYFWCLLQDGSWDYCIPRPESDYFGNDCGNNCKIDIQKLPGILHGYSQIATLYLQEHFHGKFITITSSINTDCFNLDYSDQLTMNFNNALHSIKVAPGTCVRAFSSAGCTGTVTVLSIWDNKNCLRELKRCDLSDKISSISFCRTISSFNYTKNSSSPCIDDCARRGKHFYWCHITNGSWNYCSPAVYKSGHHCTGNCSDKETSFSLNRQKATMYLDKYFKGAHVTIDSASKQKCFNLEYDFEKATSFYKTIASISMSNEACLRLYDNIACTGKVLEVSHAANTRCHRDLQACSWDSRVSSVSFCNAKFPPDWTPGKGNLFEDCYENVNCEAQGSVYFWCDTKTDWDFCSTKPGINYMGEDFEAERSFNKELDSISSEYRMHPVLYDQKEFFGNYYILEEVRRSNCLNIWYDNRTSDFHKNLGSVDLKWNCLVLFEEIGCTGDSLEIFPDDTEKYHRNLEAHGWSHRVTSISLCDAYLPPKFSLANGSRGEYCMDACQSRGKPYFWCPLKSDPDSLNSLDDAGSQTKLSCICVLFVILTVFCYCDT